MPPGIPLLSANPLLNSLPRTAFLPFPRHPSSTRGSWSGPVWPSREPALSSDYFWLSLAPPLPCPSTHARALPRGTSCSVILVHHTSHCYFAAGALFSSDSTHNCSLGVIASPSQALGPPKKPHCASLPKSRAVGRVFTDQAGWFSVLGKVLTRLSRVGEIQVEGPT